MPGLEKAAIWTYYQGGHRGEGIDAGETTIFLIPRRGWFWYIPLPNDIVSVGVVASPDYLFSDSREFERAFRREAEQCQSLVECLADAEQVAPIHGLRRLAYRNRKLADDFIANLPDARN